MLTEEDYSRAAAARQQPEQGAYDGKGLGAADVKADSLDAAAAPSLLQQQGSARPQNEAFPYPTWASSAPVGDSVNELPGAGGHLAPSPSSPQLAPRSTRLAGF